MSDVRHVRPVPGAQRAPGGRRHQDHLVPVAGSYDGGVVTHGRLPSSVDDAVRVTHHAPSSVGRVVRGECKETDGPEAPDFPRRMHAPSTRVPLDVQVLCDQYPYNFEELNGVGRQPRLPPGPPEEL